MPVEEKTVLNITCDNPDCPGNELDATDRTGWMFVSSEVYGEPTRQHVFCSPSCAGTGVATLPPEEPEMPTPPPAPVEEMTLTEEDVGRIPQ